jgi:hypothetical protein
MKSYIPLDSLPEGFHAPYREYVEAMLADGWTLNHGPWSTGYADNEPHVSVGDRTVTLTRDDFVVWFVDRTNQPTRWRPKAYDEQWTASWAGNGLHAIKLPETYSWQAFLDAKALCPECLRRVGVENLRSLGFAGKICVDCDRDKPEIRKTVEFPGWTN